MRLSRLPLLLVLLSLAGCASQPAPVPIIPPAPAPQQPAAPTFTQSGLASFYGAAHDGKRMASGEKFDPQALTAAHRSLALGSRVVVTNLENNRSVTVTITDRGPFVRGRIIDLSLAAARALGMIERGVARVRVEALPTISPAS